METYKYFVNITLETKISAVSDKYYEAVMTVLRELPMATMSISISRVVEVRKEE